MSQLEEAQIFICVTVFPRVSIKTANAALNYGAFCILKLLCVIRYLIKLMS